MFGELLPQGGGDPIPLLQRKLVIGRRDSCDVALRFPNVSNRHCELELFGGYWMVRDLASSNGTKVNGVRIRAKWILPGDELSVARHRFKIEYSIPPDAPPPPAIDDEEDINVSLLEKAGLVRRRNAPPSTASAPPRPPNGRPQADRGATDEDRAVDWLAGDDG
jgi:adenylate cyclase